MCFPSMANLLLLSVKFRVNPWQILLLGFLLPSVAKLLLGLLLLSVKFRVNPWLSFCLVCLINSDHSKTKRPTDHEDPWVS